MYGLSDFLSFGVFKVKMYTHLIVLELLQNLVLQL